jgi:hypothetical protein
MTVALVAVIAFTVGYAAACYRPLQRIDNWAWDQVHRRNRDLRHGPARRRPGWFAAQAVFAIEILGLLVIRPRQMVQEFRHRHDPPPPRSPAVRINPVSGEPR